MMMSVFIGIFSSNVQEMATLTARMLPLPID
jgi:hypothetical protein